MTAKIHSSCFIACLLTTTTSLIWAQETDEKIVPQSTEIKNEAIKTDVVVASQDLSQQDAANAEKPLHDDDASIADIDNSNAPTPTDDLSTTEISSNDGIVVATEDNTEEDETQTPTPKFGKQSGAAVFKRLRKTFSGPICKDTAAIANWKKRYAGNQKAFNQHLREILPLLDYVSVEVERRKLPGEYALIPIIESRYQPQAVGAGGPAGLWQMIGSTAKNHGIKIHNGYDGRFSVVDSTDAALSYLQNLQPLFKDWQRVVMGYNAGEFRVLRAIKNSPKSGSEHDQWPNGLSHITYAYVTKLQALSCVIAKPKAYGVSLPNDFQFTSLSAVQIDDNTHSLEKVAKHLGVDASALRAHNAGYKNGMITANAPRRLLLPTTASTKSATMINNEAADADLAPVADNLPDTSSTKSAANTKTHKVKSGDTLWGIAKRYGVSLRALKQLNGIGANTALRIGQKLQLASP
jgi:membrane-bound lytic murein transglycosylase D